MLHPDTTGVSVSTLLSYIHPHQLIHTTLLYISLYSFLHIYTIPNYLYPICSPHLHLYTSPSRYITFSGRSSSLDELLVSVRYKFSFLCFSSYFFTLSFATTYCPYSYPSLHLPIQLHPNFFLQPYHTFSPSFNTSYISNSLLYQFFFTLLCINSHHFITSIQFYSKHYSTNKYQSIKLKQIQNIILLSFSLHPHDHV